MFTASLLFSLVKMQLDRQLLLAHCTIHALSVGAGLIVVVPMALNGSAFKGRCALFSRGSWRGDDLRYFRDSKKLPQLWWYSSGVHWQLVNLLHLWPFLLSCTAQFRAGDFSFNFTDDTMSLLQVKSHFSSSTPCFSIEMKLMERHSPPKLNLLHLSLCVCSLTVTLFSSFLTMLLSVCMLFLSGGASVILSLGFIKWCDTVTDHNRQLFNCAEAESVLLYLDVNTSSFYTELSLAEIFLWAVTALWLTQSILAFLRLYHSHSQNMGGPCLPREKQCLLDYSPSDRLSLPAATPTILVSRKVSELIKTSTVWRDYLFINTEDACTTRNQKELAQIGYNGKFLLSKET